MNESGQPITAIVLCGGPAARLGGQAKPLLDLAGQPLVAHVIDRLEPQVDGIVLACAAPGAIAYREFGCPVLLDAEADQGPLAGFAAALSSPFAPASIRQHWLLLAPADAPFLPQDLVARLAPACRDQGAAVASAGGQRQNLVMLLTQPRAADLAAFFAAGGRAAKRWLDAEHVPTVEFPADAFENVNTEADLKAARQRLGPTK